MAALNLAYQHPFELASATEQRFMTNPIHELLLSIGIPPNIYGYAYTAYAIELLLMDEEYQHYITKGLYVDIATKFNTTPSRVERAIRHAISVAWLHGNINLINYIFKNCVRPDKSVPTNSVFLSRLFYYIKDASSK